MSARGFQLLTAACAVAVVARLVHRGFVHPLRSRKELPKAPVVQLLRLPAVLVTMIVQSLSLSDRVRVAQLNRFLRGHCHRPDVHQNGYYSLYVRAHDDLLRHRLQGLASIRAVGVRLVNSPEDWNAVRLNSFFSPLFLNSSLKALDASGSVVEASTLARLTQLTWLSWHNCDASMPRLASSLVGLQHLSCGSWWKNTLIDLIRMLENLSELRSLQLSLHEDLFLERPSYHLVGEPLLNVCQNLTSVVSLFDFVPRTCFVGASEHDFAAPRNQARFQ